jgi:hypothetical protein
LSRQLGYSPLMGLMMTELDPESVTLPSQGYWEI